MSQALEILRRLEALHINMFAAVIVAALIAALIEQRWRGRHTPLFSRTHLDVAPPAERPKSRKGAKR
jgi:hypothetical protein